MNSLLILNKYVGETPLACMERFRAEHPEYEGVKMTYAGRLDPIASGVLLVLTGGRVHEKESYLGLPKTYECTALLGVATDTYDVLGMIDAKTLSTIVERVGGAADRVRFGQRHPPASDTRFARIDFPLEGKSSERGGAEQVLQAMIGTFQQTYPPYSSKTVNGVQLHQIAREGRIADVEIPGRMVTVRSITGVERREISRSEISRLISSIINLVSGDFRQQEILGTWEKFFKDSPEESFTLVSFTISVSGGTYIRSIVNSLGEKLGCGACILSLHRTFVGDFTLDQSNNS